MILLEFRLWLEDEETYNKKFKPRAEKAAARLEGKHPFAHWFPAGGERIALPLNTSAFSSATHFLKSTSYISPEDKQVIKGLQDLGYEIHDYRQGYVKRGAGVEKIGGLLEKLIRFAPEEKKEQYRRWLNIFVNSHARKDKNMEGNDFWIIISRNPHDIAQMSYDREWTSCMELEDGAYKNTPFCVIGTGGMVAYLVRQPQPEVEQLVKSQEYIKNPIARLTIKAAVNAKDKSQIIAIPETKVYPQNITGFYETIIDWLESHQGNIGSGRFRVLGGYSDDYGTHDSRASHHRAPRQPEQLMHWLSSNIESRRHAAIKMVLDSRIEYPKEIYQKIKEVLTTRLKSYVGWADNSPSELNQQIVYMAKRFPELFTDEDKKHFNFYVKDKLDLLNKYDRVASDFGKQFMHQFHQGKAVVPTEGDMKKLQHYLADIYQGKGKFTDARSFGYLTDYVFHNANDLVTMYNGNSNNRANAISPRRKEIMDNITITAENLFSIINSKDKISDNFDSSVGLTSYLERLIEVTMDRIRLVPGLVDKLEKTLRKLGTEGNRFLLQKVLYSLPSTIQAYQDQPAIYQALMNLKNSLNNILGLKQEYALDAENPPTQHQQEKLHPEDQYRLDIYIKNGQLSINDVADMKKMMSDGWRFDDALSRVLQQANQRKYLGTRHRDIP